MSNLYCEAKFWRPTGLGNRLFSWARCKVFSRETGAVMLSPSWAHLRGASIIRGGINYSTAYRKILLFDNFKKGIGEVAAPGKYWLRKSCTIYPVSTLQEAMDTIVRRKPTLAQSKSALAQHTPEKVLMSFSGSLNHQFDDIRPYHEMINRSLKEITKKKWLQNIPSHPYIGINVRMGKDFKEAANMQEFLHNKRDYLRTPMRWYIESLRFIRRQAGYDIPALLISDGNKKDLGEILQEPAIEFAASSSAIGDLLILSGSSIFIGSGRSSFSAWASFLGQMPTITIPGTSLQSFHISEDLSRHYVGELDMDKPDEIFLKKIKRIAHVSID